MTELFEAMNERNAKMRYPSALLAIDERLYVYRGCIGFKQYKLPNLPNMAYCTKVSVILREPTHTSVWCMLAKEK